MYRQPLERLVSGYRSKVARYPLSGLYDDKPHFNWLRKSVLLQTQPEQYSAYIHCRGKTAINISFPDFIQYWLSEPPRLKDDEHFSPISSLCQPCRTQFTFYGNFKQFNVDSQILVENIKAEPQYLRDSYYGGDTTAQVAPQLYAQLSQQQKHKVLALLAQELDFFYHIFPEEVNSHKTIMSLDADLPRPQWQSFVNSKSCINKIKLIHCDDVVHTIAPLFPVIWHDCYILMGTGNNKTRAHLS